jgi:alpha-D-ribose 1-methylphosphonate 5-triphosphate synthase subunit PhnI
VGYVAVTAGEELIERAEDLFEKRRLEGEEPLVSVDQIDEQLGRLTAQAMSEGGLYAPRIAARAVKQAQGDTTEAAFLLRAYRSTLERWGETLPADHDDVFATRRVSPAYKDVPGGQILGATKDYTQRLLDFDLDEGPRDPTADWDLGDDPPERLRNVMTVLREEELVAGHGADGDDANAQQGADGTEEGTEEPGDTVESNDPEEPFDTTRDPVLFPAPRDAVLQELARGETGAITALGYSSLRGYGSVHPTLAEVRTGDLPVTVEHPYTGEPAEVTSAQITETESVVPVYAKRDDPRFSFGYGLVFGRNERKAIGMSILDAGIQLGGDEPAEDGEFVLDVVDGIDSFGFIEHLKLPHYVTFQSTLDRIRALRERRSAGVDTPAGGTGDVPENEDTPADTATETAPEASDDD